MTDAGGPAQAAAKSDGANGVGRMGCPQVWFGA
jgi:hypothetical protein